MKWKILIVLLLLTTTMVYSIDPKNIETYNKVIHVEEIRNLSIEELNLLKNGFLAKAGYIFESQELKNFFNALTWYKPVDDKTKVFEALSEQDKYNYTLIDFAEEMKSEPLKSFHFVEHVPLDIYRIFHEGPAESAYDVYEDGTFTSGINKYYEKGTWKVEDGIYYFEATELVTQVGIGEPSYEMYGVYYPDYVEQIKSIKKSYKLDLLTIRLQAWVILSEAYKDLDYYDNENLEMAGILRSDYTDKIKRIQSYFNYIFYSDTSSFAERYFPDDLLIYKGK